MSSNVYSWGPPIWKTNLKEIIVDELLTRGNQVRHNEKFNAEHDLAMNTHDEWQYTSEDTQWFSEHIEDKIKDYMSIWSEHLDRPVQTFKFKIESLWINYMKKDNFNPLHEHSGNISFVLYLNDVEELKTERLRYKQKDTGPVPGTIMFAHDGDRKFFFPKKGDLLIFPANLMHMVVPFRSDIERISVSGNILL